ncbi:hypothetical protein GB931_14240 [Modestobacter sp. I12A-02628]|uniref:DNA-directed RNA polymerase specialized sigma24 family protein n=1 Tax=Goekera deserti TaxID=2497753 RepID=A0A7K3WHJ0_9ACTN|nr:hypothetical protein [Goekera deserti]MPQ99060.1 hypothetical protein [Goekera deserti]NDI47394.1 hypothetical protein [Goekera deserti]NEL55924.1 hypothetical protein [Goekera deserti]
MTGLPDAARPRGAGGPQSWRARAEQERPALLGTALLLTGDRAAAEELVQRALARGVRHPERLLQQLVAAYTGRRVRLRAEQVLESAGPPPAEPQPARALRELPMAERAAVVLRHHAGLDAEATARLLGRPTDRVGAATARAEQALLAVLPGEGFRRPGTARTDGERVQDALAALAGGPGGWRLDTGQALADALARRRSGRRRVLGALLAAAVLLGVGVPLSRQLPGPPPAAAPAGAPDPPSVPVLVEPARGSLAGDADVVEAVRRRDWPGMVAPPVADRDVVFVADTPGGRVALVAGTVDDDVRGIWFTGPTGSPVAALTPHVPAGLGRDRPAALAVGAPDAVTVVVVAAPGDRVEVSDRLQVGPRGTVARVYTDAGAVDGTAVLGARSTAGGLGTSVRVLRGDQLVSRSPVAWPDRPDVVAPPPALGALRVPAAPPDERAVAAALRETAVPLATEPADMAPAVLWAGAASASGGGAVVLVGRSPGGGLVVTTWASRGPSVVPCGTQTPPGDTRRERLTVARVCLLPEPVYGTNRRRTTEGTAPGAGARGRGLLVFTAPPEARTGEVLDADERVVATLDLGAGGAVVPAPHGAVAVRTRTADGGELTTTAIAATPPQPFGDYGTGPVR